MSKLNPEHLHLTSPNMDDIEILIKTVALFAYHLENFEFSIDFCSWPEYSRKSSNS